MKRLTLQITWLLAVMFILSACRTSASGGSGPIKVGVVANQTTGFSLSGNLLLNGLRMAADEINAAGGVKGRTLELLIEDAADNNTTAVNAATKVLSQNPAVLFTPVYSTQVLAMFPVLKKSPVVTFTAATNPSISEQGANYVFGTRIDDQLNAAAAVYAAVEKLGKKKLAVYTVNNEYGKGSVQVINETVSKVGGSVLATEYYSAGDKDFRPSLKKLVDSGAEMIILFGVAPETSLILKQFKEMDLKVGLLGSSVTTSSATRNVLTDAEMNGVYAIVDQVGIPAANPNADIKAWAAKFKEKYNADPDYLSFAYYNAMKLAAKAMESGTDHETLRKTVASLKYQGLGGVAYAFDPKGDLTQPVALIQFKGKEPIMADASVRTK